ADDPEVGQPSPQPAAPGARFLGRLRRMIAPTFADAGIDVPPGATGPEVRTTCPQCSADRKKPWAKCLSVNLEKRCWLCHHCGWRGALPDSREGRPPELRRQRVYRRPDPRPSLVLPQQALDWFHARGITDGPLVRNRIDFGRVHMPDLRAEAEALIFP